MAPHIRPVSYTHLDVYKRQAPLFFMLLGGPAAGFAYKAVNTMDSVSYTHLDVYKRQRRHSPDSHRMPGPGRNGRTDEGICAGAGD